MSFLPQWRRESGVASKLGVEGDINYGPYIYVAPLILLYLIFLAYPLTQAVLMAFQQFPSLNETEWVGLANFRTVLQDPVFWTSLKNTAVVAIGKAVVPIVLGLGLALELDSAIKGDTGFRAAIFLPYVVPIAVVGILFTWLFSNSGLVNAFLLELGLIESRLPWISSSDLAMPVVLILNIWRNTGYFMVILLAGLQGIPDSMYDAAKVMGRSRWEMFRHITLPLLKPSLVIVGVLGILESVKGFADVWLVAQGGPNHATEVIATYFYKETFLYFKFGKGAAIGWIIFVITIGLSMILIKVSGDE